jgi:hypothetical protein
VTVEAGEMGAEVAAKSWENEIKKDNAKVSIIWPKPIINEENPISFMTFGFKCKPTIKRRKAIPNLENHSTSSIEAPD